MAPADARKRKSKAKPEDDHKSAAASREGTKNKRQKLPVRAKSEDDLPAATSPTSAPPAQGNLMVFGDDDDIEVPSSIPIPSASVKAPEMKPDQDDEPSDDDEAPEAVSTTKAASQIKQSALAAQKAAQEQATAEKRKRQQRDALFKQQAEERRKAEEDAAAETAGKQQNGATHTQQAVTSGRRRQDKVPVPNLLPAEFLTDSSSEDEGDVRQEQQTRPRKKRAVAAIERSLGRESRAPKDMALGSTVHRVAKKIDERLAPKSRKQSRGVKESLLRRNRSSKQKGGFLKRT